MCSIKTSFQKFPKIHRKTAVMESLFNKFVGLVSANSKKETPTEVFSCEFCENFQNYSYSYITKSLIRKHQGSSSGM